MPEPFATIILPGPGDASATVASVRAEAGDDARVLALGTDVAADLPRATAEEALAAAPVLTFLRAGDRWVPGSFAAWRRPFDAHPTAVLSAASYALVDAAGTRLLEVRPPRPPFDAQDLLLRTVIEPAAVIVRAGVLDAAALECLLRPHGDSVVWSALVAEHGLLPSWELAAEVALDPARHGFAPEARAEAIVASVRGQRDPDAHGAATVRRELLRRLFIEPDPGAALAGIDLFDTLTAGGSASSVGRAVVEDLQWALERQRDALAAERVGWVRGEVRPEEALPVMGDEELTDWRLKAEYFWNEMGVRDTEIARLKAELAERDARIALLDARRQGTEAT